MINKDLIREQELLEELEKIRYREREAKEKEYNKILNNEAKKFMDKYFISVTNRGDIKIDHIISFNVPRVNIIFYHSKAILFCIEGMLYNSERTYETKDLEELKELPKSKYNEINAYFKIELERHKNKIKDLLELC